MRLYSPPRESFLGGVFLHLGRYCARIEPVVCLPSGVDVDDVDDGTGSIGRSCFSCSSPASLENDAATTKLGSFRRSPSASARDILRSRFLTTFCSAATASLRLFTSGRMRSFGTRVRSFNSGCPSALHSFARKESLRHDPPSGGCGLHALPTMLMHPGALAGWIAGYRHVL